MANHYYSINRGVAGTKQSDITRATSSTSGDDIELRLADAASLTRMDVRLALDAFERMFAEGGSLNSTFPPGT